MTDDLGTLIIQTGGQLTGMMVHSMFTGIPATLNLIGVIANPLLLIPYGFLIGAVPIIGTMIAVGILK